MDRIGRYRIVGELGRGAMGIVYHAIDPSIGRPVAIKTIRIRDINDEQRRVKLRERLFREARSAGVLSHPNIVTIYDMDEADGLAYIAMAFVNGPTLEKIINSAGPLSGSALLKILRQTASALDYAHGRGIVHRDVKPANIMTDEDGAVKITDFGIAKLTSSGDTTDTRTIVGTPNYMSPEQVQGLTVDGKSDQFSLAVIAYEILTGDRPFTGEHLSTVVYRIVSEDPPESHRINATLTPQIDQVLRKALAKKAENRYPNCTSFVGALEMACAESRGWKTLASGAAENMATIGVEQSLTGNTSLSEGIRATEPRRRLFPVVMSLAIVLTAVGLITWQAGGIPGLKFGAGAAPAEPSSRPRDVASTPPPSAPVSAPTVDQTKPVAVDPPQAGSSAEPAPAPAEPVEPAAPEATRAPAKPSPLGDAPREVVRIPEASVSPPSESRTGTSRLQDLWVTTNPPGAKVVLDGDLNQACLSPCMLHSTSGLHHLTVSDAGYLSEYREVHVGDTAQDVPLISLRQPSGTLMVTTTPAGANVRINGKLLPQVTPTQVTLSPGSYSVTVEKAGRSQTQKIDMTESLLYLRIPLEQ